MSSNMKEQEVNIAVSYTWRRLLVMAVFCFAISALLWRAIDLQVISKDFLQGQGDVRHLRVVEVPAYRGAITDRFGEPLAISTPVDSVWANPGILLKNSSYIAEIAVALEINVDDLRKQLADRREKKFIYLRRRIDPQIVMRVKEIQAPGVGFQREYQRFYPAGEVVGHVTGFTGIDDNGQEGLELAYDKWLRGKPGRKMVIKDRLGRSVENVENIRDPNSGNDLILSLDRRIQFLAYRELKKAVSKHKAKSGSAVVLDAKTGEILAMVNQPSFNPNNRSGFKVSSVRNRSVTDVFEPGSTIKPFTVAAALELKIINPHTKFNTSPGYMRVGKNSVKDVRDFGEIDVETIIKKSSNVGTAKIALSMKPEELVSLLMKSGFGSTTASAFPGEASGHLFNKEHWHDIERATMSYGYGISTTSLQLAQAYTSFANDGLLYPASLLKQSDEIKAQKVMTKRTANQILTMMETVVGNGGTAPLAAVANYRVAGKTGTMKKSEAGGYSDSKYTAVFAGIVPVSDPKFVMVVMIDEPANGEYYGGKVAAPVFSHVMTGALRLLNIPPDNLPVAKKTRKKKGVAA